MTFNCYKAYFKELIDMIEEGESWGYIQTYINDLMRGKDITADEYKDLNSSALKRYLEYHNGTFGGTETL